MCCVLHVLGTALPGHRLLTQHHKQNVKRYRCSRSNHNHAMLEGQHTDLLVATGGTHHDAFAKQGAAPQARGIGTYPVDAWLEGREHIEDEDEALGPIQKVESLMSGIALKEIIKQGPKNPAFTDGNSMHADFGDTVTTNNTYTANNTQTTTGANGDGGVQFNYMSVAGRPPGLASGRLQDVSLNSTEIYGLPSLRMKFFAGINPATGPDGQPQGKHGSESTSGLKGGVVDDTLRSSTADLGTAVPNAAHAPQAVAAEVDLSPPREVVDLSPRRSLGADGRRSPKVWKSQQFSCTAPTCI
jgi:hypothetical protein